MKILITVLVLFLVSCSEISPGNGAFIVQSVEESSGESTYRLAPSQGMGVVFIVDAPGKYHAGDTLRLFCDPCRKVNF